MKSQRRTKLDNKDAANRLGSQMSLKSAHGDGNDGADHAGFVAPRALLKPDDQVELTEEELDEEFTRILNANDPQAPQNIARYNFKEKVYKSTPNIDHLVIHYEFDGYLLYKGGDEAKRQMTAEELAELETTHDGEVTAETPSIEKGEPKNKGPLRNQFNYSERATQTFNNPLRERSTNTEPPPQKTFCESVTQWSIFDAYVEDEFMKKKMASKEKSKAATSKNQKDDVKQTILPTESHTEDILARAEFAKSTKILERMANQNTYDDIAQDYKYWEDGSDEFRDGKGTLLPLWKFTYEMEKRKQVTALCWNPEFKDMFAVGYGSYDFLKQGPGLIAIFSLKNPSNPENIYNTESGVMSLDFHKQHSSLIAVGLYDGSVLVYNLRKKSKEPIYCSSAKTGKHTDPVWQVVWGPDDLDGNTNFYSISSDGRATQWTLLKNELIHTDIIKLRLEGDTSSDATSDPTGATDVSDAIEGNGATKLFGFAGGSCLDFNHHHDHLFVVGTEEGKIHKCSKAYNNQYLKTFDGHQMGVYAVKYNPFSPSTFVSASADWSLRLWDHNQSKPVMTFDLNSPVGDVAWAPYSSTVFAAASSDGKVYVYDLYENKYEPICEQQVVRKAKLTHLAFNPFQHILLVGDDKGTVVSLKLSPNLHKTKRPNDDTPEAERIEKIMAVVTGAAAK